MDYVLVDETPNLALKLHATVSTRDKALFAYWQRCLCLESLAYSQAVHD